MHPVSESSVRHRTERKRVELTPHSGTHTSQQLVVVLYYRQWVLEAKLPLSLPACLYVHMPREMQPRITNVLSHCLWPSCLIEGLWRDSRETWPTMLWGHVHTAWLNHYIWIMHQGYYYYYYYHHTLPRPFSCLIEGLWRDSRETWPTMLWGHVHTAWLNHYIWIMHPVYYYYHYTLPRLFLCLIGS